MANHLNLGGMLLVKPWLTPQTWLVGKIYTNTYDTENGFVMRMAVSEPIERG
jgi:hypothetical protein